MKKLMLLFLQLILVQGLFSQSIHDLVRLAGDAASYPNADELVVFDSTMVDMQESGLTYVNTHTLTKVLTAHGAMDMAVVKYGYDPLSAFVKITRAVIHKADGGETVLDVTRTLDYRSGAKSTVLPFRRTSRCNTSFIMVKYRPPAGSATGRSSILFPKKICSR